MDENAAATARLAAAIEAEIARIAAAREALRGTESEDSHLAEVASALATSMQEDLKDVLPLLAKAEQAVNGLDKADLYEIRCARARTQCDLATWCASTAAQVVHEAAVAGRARDGGSLHAPGRRKAGLGGGEEGACGGRSVGRPACVHAVGRRCWRTRGS